ncbi:MAG: hypothetical protein M1147_05680 [Nitrospirae bacterium]|nr:hypothetical protein [Nitrospirota bacterium]MCL5977608.1 hypothetical protein [Nitrospirota bacterium]
MKKFLLLLPLLALLTGCAGLLGETGAKIQYPENKEIVKIASKKINYKIYFYKTGWTRWNVVASSPESEIDDSFKLFAAIFINKTRSLLMAMGYTLNEANAAERDAYFIEMRVAFKKAITPIGSPIGGTRWFVYANNINFCEIYEWDMEGMAEQIVRASGKRQQEDIAAHIAQKAATSFLNCFK